MSGEFFWVHGWLARMGERVSGRVQFGAGLADGRRRACWKGRKGEGAGGRVQFGAGLADFGMARMGEGAGGRKEVADER